MLRYLPSAILAMFLVASVGFAITLPIPSPAPSPKIDQFLLDTNYLSKEGYLTGTTVPVIIMLNTRGALETSRAEYEAKRDNVLKVLKNTNLPYTKKLDLKIIDGFSANVDLGSLNALAASNDVKSVWLDGRGKQLQADVLTLTHTNTTPGAWTFTVGCCTGDGVIITQIDDGFNYTASELGGCAQPINNCAKIPDHWDFIDNDADIFGGIGHGTKTAILSAGATYGIAKDAKLYLYRVNLTESLFVAAVERAVDNGTDLISISTSIGSANENSPLLSAINNAYTQGVLTFASAGNSGPTGKVTAPAWGRNVVAVGSTYDNNFSTVQNQGDNQCSETDVKQNQIGCWSSRGTNDGRIKPDIVAPGYKIQTPDGSYPSTAGTSWSAPMAAGVAALIKQKHTEWNVTPIRNKIMNSSVNLTWWNSSWTYSDSQGLGRIDSYNALDDTNATNIDFDSNATGNISYRTIRLTYECYDLTNTVGDGDERIRIRNENQVWGSWEWAPPNLQSGSRDWTLSIGDGLKIVYYQCMDKGGNLDERKIETTVDTFLPITTYSQSPAPNPNGWNNQDITVTLSVNDANPDVTKYKLNNGGEQTLSGSGPFTLTLTEQRNNSLEYWSIDKAGNTETHKTEYIEIDKTAPTTTLTKAPAQPNPDGWYTVPVNITLNATDVLSGIDVKEYKLNGSVWQTYSGMFTLGNGEWDISYRSKDRASNIEATQTEPIIRIDTLRPNVQITSPQNGSVNANVGPASVNIGPLSSATGNLIGTAVVAGKVVVNGTVSNVGPSGFKLELLVGNNQTPVATFNGTVSQAFNMTWTPSPTQIGQHTLTVKARNGAGGSPTQTQSVIVLVGSV